jgi:hypothetical protein
MHHTEPCVVACSSFDIMSGVLSFLWHNTPEELGTIKCKDYSASLAYATFQNVQKNKIK